MHEIKEQPAAELGKTKKSQLSSTEFLRFRGTRETWRNDLSFSCRS